MDRSIKMVYTDKAPPPGGHYAQAVIHGGIVYISGILPVEPASGRQIHGTAAEQIERVLGNLKAILEASGSSADRVLKSTVYVTDINDWPAINTLYALFFGTHLPARTVVPVRELHHGFRVELDAVATL
jgi:2-iminobutanoate/2-iminopropanoate deaminase